MVTDTLFALLSIIYINMLLSGDNALVIALASRRLPPRHQKRAIFWGGVGAVGLRIGLSFLAIFLLKIPYLQIIGSIALEWIAIRLLLNGNDMIEDIEAESNLWGAVKTIIVADIVMSVDNVIAVAAASKGNITLLIIGILISIPIIIWGSTFIRSLMERWPVVITLGAAFLGWTAGNMFISDISLSSSLALYQWSNWLVPAIFTFFVIGTWQLSKSKIF